MMPRPQTIYIGPNTATSTTGVSNSMMLGSGAALGVSNEFMINNIHHLNIPALTTLADGTGILLQYGGAKADWVEASGGTYNSVEKIDTIISTIQGQLPAKIIFTTTSTDLANVSWTVPANTIDTAVQLPWVLLLLLRAHLGSTKEEAEVAVVR